MTGWRQSRLPKSCKKRANARIVTLRENRSERALPSTPPFPESILASVRERRCLNSLSGKLIAVMMDVPAESIGRRTESSLSGEVAAIGPKNHDTEEPAKPGVALSSVEEDSTLCRHPSRCRLKRSVKRNGKLHWLCEHHRQRQNAEQRERYQRKNQDIARPSEHNASSVRVSGEGVSRAEFSPSVVKRSGAGDGDFGSHQSNRCTEVDSSTPGSIRLRNTERCAFSGRCGLQRARKRNGELHRLCVYHRSHTNQLQRERWRAQRAQKVGGGRALGVEKSMSAAEIGEAGEAEQISSPRQLSSALACSSSASDGTCFSRGKSLQALDSVCSSMVGSLTDIIKVQRDELLRRIEGDRLLLEKYEAILTEHSKKGYA